MSKEKTPEREQFTIRLPENVHEYLNTKSKEIGCSKNSLVMVLINMGMKTYESEIIRNPHD